MSQYYNTENDHSFLSSKQTKSTPFSRAALIMICTLIVLTPLMRGSVHLWSKSLIQLLTLIAVTALVLERLFMRKKTIRFISSPLNIPIIALILLTTISAVFSSHRFLAVEGSMMFMTYILIYYTTLNAVRSREEKRLVVYVIIAAALLISMIGLLKNFGLNPFSWWEYPELHYAVHFMSGPYGNHNHMAGFLEMTIPMVLILFMTRQRSLEVVIGLLCLVLFLLVIQGLTLSRGGWASTSASLLLMLFILLFQKGFKRKKMLVGITCFAIIIGGILLVSTPVINRLTTLTQETTEESMGGRMVCWQGTIELISEHYMTGTGPGTYEEAYPKYQPAGLNVLYDYAHNDYLEIVSNLGIGVIPILIWIVILFYKSCFENMKLPSRQIRGITLGVMAAVFAILIHSLGDFNLQIPANAVLFSVLCALP